MKRAACAALTATVLPPTPKQTGSFWHQHRNLGLFLIPCGGISFSRGWGGECSGLPSHKCICSQRLWAFSLGPYYFCILEREIHWLNMLAGQAAS